MLRTSNWSTLQLLCAEETDMCSYCFKHCPCVLNFLIGSEPKVPRCIENFLVKVGSQLVLRNKTCLQQASWKISQRKLLHNKCCWVNWPTERIITLVQVFCTSLNSNTYQTKYRLSVDKSAGLVKLVNYI